MSYGINQQQWEFRGLHLVASESPVTRARTEMATLVVSVIACCQLQARR
jgi:hypothetical protein